MLGIRRRDFIRVLGGAVVLPMAAGGQQQAARPVVAVLSSGAPSEQGESQRAAFRQGLRDWGYDEGRNVAVEYYLADKERMPSIIAVLISRNVSIIIANGNIAALLAKAATKSIPIVFAIGGDPVDLDLVPSLARPGGNLTGFTNLNNELESKRFEILTELVPRAATIGVVLDAGAAASDAKLVELEPAARRLGRKLRVLKAGNEVELERAFAIAANEHIGALQITTSNYFASQVKKFAALASRYAVPSIYASRVFAAEGGLASYGPKVNELERQVGIYAGRVLKGEKPADLPVIQSAQFDFVLNLKTARTLGIAVPLSLLGRADEVIE